MTYKALSLRRGIRLVVIAALLLCFGICAGAQVQSGAPFPTAEPRHNTDDAAWEAQQQKRLAKASNLQRQQDLKKDSEKLLELATELKQYVDKSNENTLSLDVIKKAEQIEKLAKAVKEKMKGP